MLMASQYMDFVEINTSGKTKRYAIFSLSNRSQLGEIKWWGPWRQYCFFPADDTVFNSGCMEDIQAAIKLLMLERVRVSK